jgi:hypothetical protein
MSKQKQYHNAPPKRQATEGGLDFHFKGIPVGCFKAETYPRGPGQYPYTPYNEAGHELMQLRLQLYGRARCYYDTETARVFFSVVANPDYGLLELTAFERIEGGARCPLAHS